MSTEVVSLSRTSERAYRRGIVASKRSGHTEFANANCMTKTKKAVIELNELNELDELDELLYQVFSREKMETFDEFAEYTLRTSIEKTNNIFLCPPTNTTCGSVIIIE